MFHSHIDITAQAVSLLHPHFAGPANATHLLIRAAKTLILLRKQHPYSRNVMRNATLNFFEKILKIN
jgi:hypothetical protein